MQASSEFRQLTLAISVLPAPILPSARQNFIGNILGRFMNDRWKVIFEEKCSLSFKIIKIFLRQLNCELPAASTKPNLLVEMFQMFRLLGELAISFGLAVRV